MRVRGWVVAGLAFGPLWAFVNGAQLTAQSLAANLLVGTAVGLVVTYLFRRFYQEEIDVVRTLTVIPYVILYIGTFTREVIEANLDVTYRVLAPHMPIEPQVIYVPLRVETDMGVTTIANSITITPGTVTLDHDPDDNALYIHLIDGRDPHAVVEPIRQWEDYALVIFDEELSPEDPPPDIRVHPPDHPPEPKTRPEMLPIQREAMTRGAETIPTEEEGGDDDGR